MKRFGIVYHPKIPVAKSLAEQLLQFFSSQEITAWTCSSFEEENIRARIEGTDLVLSIGGDGTILRLNQAITPKEIPVLGVNVGHLGFMTEVPAAEIMDKLPSIIKGEGWIEQRSMLEIELHSKNIENPSQTLYALNEAAIGRGAIPRVIYIKTTIDGEFLTTHKADGLIVSTANGSTSYSLAAGGPILHPQAKEIILQSISPHLTMPYALVLPSTSTIEMEVLTDHQAILSIDGQKNFTLQDGDKIKAKRSPHPACFLRMHSPAFFYQVLEERLKARS